MLPSKNDLICVLVLTAGLVAMMLLVAWPVGQLPLTVGR